MYPLTLTWTRRCSGVRQTSLGLFVGVVWWEVRRALINICGRVESSVIL